MFQNWSRKSEYFLWNIPETYCSMSYSDLQGSRTDNSWTPNASSGNYFRGGYTILPGKRIWFIGPIGSNHSLIMNEHFEFRSGYEAFER